MNQRIRILQQLGEEFEHALAHPPAPQRRHRRMSVGGLAGNVVVAAAVALTLAIGAGALLVLGGHKSIPAGRAEPNSRQQLIELLGVLRRPQTKADLPPALRARLSQYRGRPFNGSADLPLVRFGTVTPWGDRYFLVPLNPPTAETLAAAARRLKLSQAFLSSQTVRILGTGEQVLLMSPGGDGDCCFTIPAIKAGHDLHTTEVSGHRGYSATRAVAVIPDGVATVGIDIPAQKLRRFPNSPLNSQANITRPAHLLLPVHNNLIAFEIHQGGAGCCLTATMTWYGPDGQIIKRVSGP